MTRRLIHVIVALAVILAGAVSYLGVITLPVKINTTVVEELEKVTGKKILIEAIRFNLFKGLVLEDLVIYDRNEIFVWAKSVSCGIPLSGLLENRVAIPAVMIDSPAVYVDRRPDSSFNIRELIPAAYKPSAATVVVLQRIIVKNARVIFVDRTLEPAFKERIDDISMDIRLSLPDKVALNLSCDIPLKSSAYFKFSGVYYTSSMELAGRLGVKNFNPNEFKDYYRASGISFPRGFIDAEGDLRVKDNAVELDFDGRIEGLGINKEKLNIKLDSLIKLMARYELKDKTFEYAGKLDVSRMDLSGVEAVGKLENIKANIEFNDSRLWSENIIADAYGMRWKARVNIFNFASPIFDIYADSEAHLSVIQNMLKEEFNIKLPTDIAGKAGIKLAIQMQPDKPLKMNGYVTLDGATVSLGAGNFPIEGVTGEAQFNLDGAKWSGIKLRYREASYVSSGSLVNFAAPKIDIEASSPDLSFKSALSVKGPAVKISSLKGRYFGSTFSVSGDAVFPDRKPIKADIKGALKLDLTDLKKMIKDFAEFEKIKLAGKITAEFNLNGDPGSLKACKIRARIKSPDVSVYGLKFTGMAIDYAQTGGAGQIKFIKSLLYGGSLYASGGIDWKAGDLPYSFNIDIKDVKLEDLKADTGFKDKDVSGDITALAKLTGAFKDSAKFSGTGRLSIKNGRLWQLNLFKGLGAIIFSRDFSDIAFTEGSCDIKIAREFFTVNNFVLNSDLLNLYGSGTIGFNKSVDAVLRPEIRESAVDYGSAGAIAVAVSSNTVVKITGTLEKPEYKTQANLADVMGGIANAMFKR
ncbi:MAG: hypothetical protein NTY76_06085 [Candidatus Omnitrophica bacterium]|nr:hypothetical protein [Candidatus Omnitrophota bacterium]